MDKSLKIRIREIPMTALPEDMDGGSEVFATNDEGLIIQIARYEYRFRGELYFHTSFQNRDALLEEVELKQEEHLIYAHGAYTKIYNLLKTGMIDKTIAGAIFLGLEELHSSLADDIKDNEWIKEPERLKELPMQYTVNRRIAGQYVGYAEICLTGRNLDPPQTDRSR